MLTIKGFYSIPELYNNDPDTTSELGELTQKLYTYSNDVALYKAPNTVGSLHIFKVKDENGITLDSGYSKPAGEAISEVMSWIYSRAKLRAASGFDMTALTSDFNAEFNAEYDSLQLGPAVEIVFNTAPLFLPSWVSFTTVSDEYDYRVWFSADDFAGQYNEFDLILIPPVSDIDNLLVGTAAELNAAVNTRYQIERITDESRSRIFTETSTAEFEWISPTNSEEKSSLSWVYMVNGGGYSFDDIKEAIKSYINNNSNSPGSWNTTLPSLYGTNEYIVIPHWSRLSIENITAASSFYSPTVRPEDIEQYAQNYPGALDPADITGNVEYVPVNYRGIGISIVSNPASVEGAIPFYDKIRDYMPFSANSNDFQRMSKTAQDWSRKMVEAIMVAEAYTSGAALPNGITAVQRGSNTFLTFSLEGVEYLVAPRIAYTDYVTP